MDGDPIALVLAGGASARMGYPKPLAELGGRTLIEHPIAAASDAGISPVVVAKPDSVLPPLGCPVLREPMEPRHPLLGVVSALTGALDLDSEGPLVSIPCDMPFVSPALLRWLAGLPDRLVVCEASGRLQPLLGRYDRSLSGPLAEAVEAGTSAREAVRRLGARIVSEDDLLRFGDPAALLFNVNTPDDLERARHLLES